MSHEPQPDTLTPEEEAVMQQEIETAITPYKGTAPPFMLDVMRRQAEEHMRSHPATRLMLAAIAKRAVPDRSGEVLIGSKKPVPQPEKAGKAGKKEGA